MFDAPVSEATVAKALAAYQRTLVSGTAPYDRWASGDKGAISPAAVRGFGVFLKSGCAACHSGSNFSDGDFYDVGLPSADRGRGAVTRQGRDDHAFRTPSLREIGRTAPYMHDGSLATLGDVVEHYSGKLKRRRQAPRVVRLVDQEKRDLIAFLETLDSLGSH